MENRMVIEDCIKVFTVNKEIYIHNEDIINEMEKYYEKYEEKEIIILSEFIKFVKNRLNMDDRYMKRYEMYKRRELFDWFYSEEFKEKMSEINIRDKSNIEYYVYLSNKKMNNEIKKMKLMIRYMIIVIIVMMMMNVYVN
jgi:hypothetical protein